MKKDNSYKELYESLKSTGELRKMFPSLRGSWAKDGETFIRLQQNMEDVVNNLNVDLDDDY